MSNSLILQMRKRHHRSVWPFQKDGNVGRMGLRVGSEVTCFSQIVFLYPLSPSSSPSNLLQLYQFQSFHRNHVIKGHLETSWDLILAYFLSCHLLNFCETTQIWSYLLSQWSALSPPCTKQNYNIPLALASAFFLPSRSLDGVTWSQGFEDHLLLL